jgi:tetratricopeptide (TPR) repeat protein
MTDNVEKKAIFVSYSSKDVDIVNIVEKSLMAQLPSYISFSRYDKDVKYKESFKEFMKTIKQHDFVLSIISSRYLKSKACLYEIGELITDDSYQDKMLFIVLRDSDSVYYTASPDSEVGALIYTNSGKYTYIHYWQEQKNEIVTLLKGLEEAAKQILQNELREIEKILQNDIGVLMEYLCDARGIPFEELHKSNFADIVDYIHPKNIGMFDDFEAGTLSDEEKAQIYYNRARKSERQMKIVLLQGAIALQPDNPVYHNSLGIQYSTIDNYDAAIREKSKAIDLEPNARYYSSRGTTYHVWGDFEKKNGNTDNATIHYNEALRDHKQAVILNPSYTKYQYGLASSYYWLNSYEEAIEPLEKAIEFNPSNMGYRHNLSVLYHLLGREDDAVEVRREIKSIVPERLGYYDLIYPNWITQ